MFFFLKLLILAKMKKHSIGEREREKAKHEQGMARQNILTGNREQ
jgi:hypothetical protein